MVRFLLVLTWYACPLPDPKAPCVESEVHNYSSESDAIEAYNGYHAENALDRRLYRMKVNLACDTVVCSQAMAFSLEPVRLVPDSSCSSLERDMAKPHLPDWLREHFSENLKECRTAIQNRALNRISCGKDKCP